MARKKAEVTEVTEEIQEAVVAEPVEEIVEEVKPKRTRKKKVEDPVVKVKPAPEEIPAEALTAEDLPWSQTPVNPLTDEPIISFQVVEAAEHEPTHEPEVVETIDVKSEDAAEVPYNAVVKAAVQLNVMKEPKVLCTKVGALRPGARIKILEVSGNFGKIGTGRWVNINYIEKI